jgi:hypothetical protein
VARVKLGKTVDCSIRVTTTDYVFYVTQGDQTIGRIALYYILGALARKSHSGFILEALWPVQRPCTSGWINRKTELFGFSYFYAAVDLRKQKCLAARTARHSYLAVTSYQACPS